MDALHAQTGHARYLVEDHRAHYLLSGRDSQSTLVRQLRRLPWSQVPVPDQSRDRAGREEVREAKVVTVKDVTFCEEPSQVRRHHTPAVMSALRNLARAALHRAVWVNIGSGRRAHTQPAAVLAPTESRDQRRERVSSRGPDHGPADQGLCAGGLAFVVAGEASSHGDPAEGPLDRPAFGLDVEAALTGLFADDVHCTPQGVGGPLDWARRPAKPWSAQTAL